MKCLEDMTEPELGRTMGEVFNSIKWALPTNTLFVLLAFDDVKIAQYISNANRQDIIHAMRECADRLERKQDVTR